jgi:hypothetical protein
MIENGFGNALGTEARAAQYVVELSRFEPAATEIERQHMRREAPRYQSFGNGRKQPSDVKMILEYDEQLRCAGEPTQGRFVERRK